MLHGILSISHNKTRTSKVGAISKAQKAQNIILEKTNVHSVAKYQISKKLKGGFFNIHSVAKIEEKIFLFGKKSHNAEKKLKGGHPLGILNIHSVAKHQKNAGDPLVLPGMVCYAEKQGKPLWSSSLGQMVQFDTIIFCRTSKNYFGQLLLLLMWIYSFR